MLRRARKPLLLAATILGVPLLLALAAAGLALTTTTGARLALGALASALPGAVTYGRIDGSLASGLVLTNLRYESPEVAATLRRIEIDARLGALFDGRIVLTKVAIEDGSATLRESDSQRAEASGEPPALPDVPDWLVVQSLQLRSVDVDGPGVAVTRLDARVEGSAIAIDALEADVAGGRIAASGHAHLGDDATARIEGSWTSGPSDSADSGATRVDLGADLDVMASVSPWRATLAWDRLAVEAAGARWESPMGRLTATPGTMPIEAALSAELTSSVLPAPAALSGSARLTGEIVTIEALSFETSAGRIVARGVADFGALAGYATVDASMLDPSVIDARIEGTLRGEAVAAFSMQPETVVGATATLAGMLGGRPLDGALRASLRGSSAHIERAHIELAESVVEAAGRVSAEAVDLTFNAELPALASWFPPAAGSLSAAGALEGSASDPAIDMELHVDDFSVETLPPLDELSVNVAGTLSHHTARLTARSALGAVELRVAQGWDRERLAGSVLESRLAVERAGMWTLTQPAEYGVAGSNASLERLCYAGPQAARLCASIADDTLHVDAADLPSSLAEPWLGGVQLRGAANLMLTLGWRPSLHGSLALHQPTLRLAQRSEAAAGEPTAAELASLDDVRLTADLTKQALKTQVAASLAATGDALEAQATLAPPTAQGMLDASLSAELTSLELLDALVEDVEQLTGSLAMRLNATGSLSDLALGGEITASSLSASVPRLGIEITDGQVRAEPNGFEAFELTATLCSMGCLELDGSLDLAGGTAPWRATATLRGDSFEAVDVEDLRAVIAPQLALDATPAALRVTGDLAIEEGLAAVEAVPRSAVRPVPETVVHGGPEEAEPEELPIPLVVDVDVRLGDEVRFRGLGISAELDGTLGIMRTAEGQLLVSGTASIEEGTFSAYSQQLTIERGDLLFTGASDNPALDVRASREVEGATVGLAVTGTLRNPESEVFSMPMLTESEALARLVTGRSLASAGTADADAIERAALGLGIRRALPALERVGNNLGLDELGVDSGNGEESALVAGRQLGEDVYLRYKHGLFDDFAGLELIYRITERFRLRTETGTSQSIDLLYERNREEDAPLSETESGFRNSESRAVPEAGAPSQLE